ncbi:MAG: hypothetical protein ABJH06_16865 [Paraglaciecola sp.]|uniref:hypothetical protein n=1 Tax=Paraglaciecola sp. TaxID=1920173 RepID=UPI0032660E2A
MKMNVISITLSLLMFILSDKALAVQEIHQHKSRDIGAETPIPKIELTIFKDMMDGVNIHVNVQNYLLNAPDIAKNPQSLTPEGFLQGHAHVFVNGQKRRRLYGSDIHIPLEWLKEGVNQIAISLNSHQHENWMSGEHNIVSSIFFDLSKDPIVLHDFTTQPLDSKHAHH